MEIEKTAYGRVSEMCQWPRAVGIRHGRVQLKLGSSPFDRDE
jgi:hypothetical protein